jgi:hypothetical protein
MTLKAGNRQTILNGQDSIILACLLDQLGELGFGFTQADLLHLNTPSAVD